MDFVVDKMDSWNRLMALVLEFGSERSQHKGNIKRLIQSATNLHSFLKTALPEIKQVLSNYLNQNRNEIWLRFYIRDGHAAFCKMMMDGFPNEEYHPSLVTEWPKANLPAKYCLALAEDIVQDAIYNCHFVNYNDEELQKIHENKPCLGTVTSCQLCKAMEEAWVKRATTAVFKADHPFLNSSIHESFIEEYKVKINVDPNWVYPLDLEFGDCIRHAIEYDELQEFINIIREYDDTIEPSSAKQKIDILFKAITEEALGWRLPELFALSSYNIFIMLWHRIHILDYILDKDLKKLKKLVDATNRDGGHGDTPRQTVEALKTSNL